MVRRGGEYEDKRGGMWIESEVMVSDLREMEKNWIQRCWRERDRERGGEGG